MHAARRQREHHVARLHAGIVDDLFRVDHADREACEVVLLFGHQPGMLGSLAADERAARAHAPFRNAAHDRGDLLGEVSAAGDIVEKDDGLRAAADDVVHAHGDAVDPHRVVFIHEERELDLRADAVRSRDEHGLFHARDVKREQPAEAADVRLALGHGTGNVLFHQLDRLVSCGDVYARFFVAFGITLFHGNLLFVL